MDQKPLSATRCRYPFRARDHAQTCSAIRSTTAAGSPSSTSWITTRTSAAPAPWTIFCGGRRVKLGVRPLLQTVLPHPHVQLLTRETQYFGGFGFVEPRVLKSLFDHGALDGENV